MALYSSALLAIPHFLPVEDEYKGYRLPAGSIVMPNTWFVLDLPLKVNIFI
jgi:hypothetical protein